MTNYLLIVISGYLLGMLPFAFIVGKLVGKVDIRNHGSGNAGATNAFRVLGFKAGLLAFIGDFLKGVIAVLIGKSILGLTGGVMAGTVAVFAHCYPITLKFKGGKGVATTAGLVIAVNPMIFLILLVIQFGIIFTTRYMSLASVTSAILFPVISHFLGMSTRFVIVASILGLLVIYRHRANIQRLLKGEESRLKFKK